MSGGTLHYEHCSTSPACVVLTELSDQVCVKVITNYAGLPSTSKWTNVLASLLLLKFKLTHALKQINSQGMSV